MSVVYPGDENTLRVTYCFTKASKIISTGAFIEKLSTSMRPFMLEGVCCDVEVQVYNEVENLDMVVVEVHGVCPASREMKPVLRYLVDVLEAIEGCRKDASLVKSSFDFFNFGILDPRSVLLVLSNKGEVLVRNGTWW